MSSSDAATLTVLGSGTLLPDDGRHSAAHWLRRRELRLLLDAGHGTVHGLARHRKAWHRVTHIAITHYHADHVGDLPGLMFALRHALPEPREAPLTLIGPPGFADFVTRLAGVLGEHVTDPGFACEVREVAPEEVLELGEDVTLTATSTPHTEESVAYRVETPEGAVGYTGDTGPSQEVARFMRGVRVLVAECALPDPPPVDLHLSPASVAEMATLAEPELLLLTHVFPPVAPDEMAWAVAQRGYRGRCLAARGRADYRGRPRQRQWHGVEEPGGQRLSRRHDSRRWPRLAGARARAAVALS